MKKITVITLLGVCFLVTPLFAAPKGFVFGRAPSGNTPTVSPILLIAAPDRFTGKSVVTDGYLFVGKTELLLFAWDEDLKHSRWLHAFELKFDTTVAHDPIDWSNLNGKRLLVAGVFRPSTTTGGLLDKISYVEEAEPTE